MSENENTEQFPSLKFPALINFYKFTGIPKYEDSLGRQKLLEDVEEWESKQKEWENKQNIKEKKNIKYLLLFLLLLPLFIYFSYTLYKLLNDHNLTLKNIVKILSIIISCAIFFMIIIHIKIISGIKKTMGNNPMMEKQHHAIYLNNVLTKLKENFFNGFRVFEFNNRCFFFYSKLGCACIDLISGEMVLYAKENIKDVLLEHINIGTNTIGTAYTSGTMDRNLIFNFHYTQDSYSDIDTDSINLYEWRLDILTDFLEFPKLSFRFADNTKGEDEAKIIYGILKP